MTKEQHDMYEELTSVIDTIESKLLSSQVFPLGVFKSPTDHWNLYTKNQDWLNYDAKSFALRSNTNDILLAGQEFADKIGPLLEKRLELLKKEREEL